MVRFGGDMKQGKLGYTLGFGCSFAASLMMSCASVKVPSEGFHGQICRFPIKSVVYFVPNENVPDKHHPQIFETLQGKVEGKCTFEISEIHGHTGETGDETTNMTLSKQRALHVQQWLGQEGYWADAAKIIAHGETNLMLKASGKTAEMLNNRVEVVITGASVSQD